MLYMTHNPPYYQTLVENEGLSAMGTAGRPPTASICSTTKHPSLRKIQPVVATRQRQQSQSASIGMGNWSGSNRIYNGAWEKISLCR